MKRKNFYTIEDSNKMKEKDEKRILFIDLDEDSNDYVETTQTSNSSLNIIICGNFGPQFEKYCDYRFHHNQSHNNKAMVMRREPINIHR